MSLKPSTAKEVAEAREIETRDERYADLDDDTFRRLVEEGQKLRKEVERRGAASRIFTPADLKMRN